MDADKENLLLIKLAEGSELAFEELFELYRRPIFTLALRLTGTQWRAEEILQDTFLKLWLKRRDVAGMENFGGWLYTVAKNITYNSLKQDQRERQKILGMVKEAILEQYPQTDHLLLDRQYNQILQEAVERLSPKQKQTYQLIRNEGLKREEAARRLGVSPETVKYHLDAAMKSIRVHCMLKLNEMSVLIALYFFLKYF